MQRKDEAQRGNAWSGGALARLLAVLFALPAVAPLAHAQITTEFKEGRFYLRDGGKVLFDTREALGNGGVRPDVQVEERDGGIDLVLHYRNANATPTPLGHVEFANWRVAGDLHLRHFRHVANESRVDIQPTGMRQWGAHYPSDSYSPVMTIRDAERTIGVTVQYPIMEYQHGVWLNLEATDQALGGFRWRFYINFTSFVKLAPGPGAFEQATLEPGEERTYRVTFRITDSPNDWFDTLNPYIDYFRETYGGMTYTPDLRAVRGFSSAQVNNQTAQNPRGFGYASRRPDRNGWRPWADAIADIRKSGYRRSMVWAPSGLFANEGYNFPFLFATPLMDMDLAAQSVGFLRGLAPRGVDLGFWWGRSQQIMWGWDEERTALLNPDDPEHVARAFAELDAAARMGVRTVGLDAFAYLPPWRAIPWLKRMQERHPRIKFVIEPSTCDIVHRHAPTWIDVVNATTRNHIADAIMPGHETWVGIRFDVVAARLGGGPLSDTQKLLEIQRVANLGFVPCVMDDVPIPTGLGASSVSQPRGPFITSVPVH